MKSSHVDCQIGKLLETSELSGMGDDRCTFSVYKHHPSLCIVSSGLYSQRFLLQTIGYLHPCWSFNSYTGRSMAVVSLTAAQ